MSEPTAQSKESLTADQLLSRAKEGDQDAFRRLIHPYRRELHFHCYRLLGVVADAEDALQETLLSAWRGLQRFEGRSPLRAWLYRIATNRCLDALREAKRQPPRLMELPFDPPRPTRVVERPRVDPYPDTMLEGLVDETRGPADLYETRETLELAFIAMLQELPPRQRAVLVLRDALGFRAAEVAEMMSSSDESVKGALKRARATVRDGLQSSPRAKPPPPDSAVERNLARRLADAFESGDLEGLVSLLTDDAVVRMPPVPIEYQGARAVGSFMGELFRWGDGRGDRLVQTRANTQPAFACFDSAGRPTGLIVLTLEDDRIAGITRFLDGGVLAPFALPSGR